MKRLRGSWAAVAILLAALLPLEQAHCMLMPLQAAATPSAPASAGATDHSCCAPSPAAQPVKSAAECPCIELPAGTVPQAVAAAPQPVSPELVVAVATSLLAAPEAATAPAPAPDVGSPPLPVACDAHGLRAPPLSA